MTVEDSYHVEISRGEFSGAPRFWATIKGPGLPADGDHRGSDNVWELCTDVTLAIQEANPEFTAPYRLIPFGNRASGSRPRLFGRRHQHRGALGPA
jgi:hypothetical protein